MNPSKIALNRIISPRLSLEELCALAAAVGAGAVELRNDLEGVDIVDNMSPPEVVRLAEKYSLSILTINALQHFNVAARRTELVSELRSLLRLAAAIQCRAVVLVPHNAVDDERDEQARYQETVAALKAFAPYFEEAGVLGYVEPLGFPECSLGSKLVALKAIRESGGGPFRIVHDTFHHAIGPDDNTALATSIPAGDIGLVHVSGMEADIPLEKAKDEHRLLVTEKDRLKNYDQIKILQKIGYRGYFSFEPFSPAVQSLSRDDLEAALRKSIAELPSE
ncbi:MAG TPA: TIM barrel protein [Spirochaetia bacterium]|nr:TIM barrel protein [Spirochaetia bacterium]